MKKKPDRRLLVAVLALAAGAATAKTFEPHKHVNQPFSGAQTSWLLQQSPQR